MGLVIKPKEAEKKDLEEESIGDHVPTCGRKTEFLQFFDINSSHIKRREKLVSSIQQKYIHLSWRSIWGFPKIVVPQNGWFIMENLIKNG